MLLTPAANALVLTLIQCAKRRERGVSEAIIVLANRIQWVFKFQWVSIQDLKLRATACYCWAMIWVNLEHRYTHLSKYSALDFDRFGLPRYQDAVQKRFFFPPVSARLVGCKMGPFRKGQAQLLEAGRFRCKLVLPWDQR